MPPHAPAASSRFSAAARHYDHHARIQRRAAAHLWNWSQHLLGDTFEPTACVDVGSGTGFLTEYLLARYPNTTIHAVDLAQGMLDELQRKHPSSSLKTHRLNGEDLAVEKLWVPSHSILMSSMCAQWFVDLEGAIRKWLSVSNTLAFSILLDGSFQVWRAAHQETGQPCGLRILPSEKHVQHIIQTLADEGLIARGAQHTKEFLDHHTDGLSFARSLRAIGADTPRHNHRPANLRKVIHALGEACTLNYNIGFYCLERP